MERRRASVYAPPWLRLAQAGRPFFPVAVDLLSRRELPRLLGEQPFEQTGLLGTGGLIEEKLLDRSGPPGMTRPVRGHPEP